MAFSTATGRYAEVSPFDACLACPQRFSIARSNASIALRSLITLSMSLYVFGRWKPLAMDWVQASLRRRFVGARPPAKSLNCLIEEEKRPRWGVRTSNPGGAVSRSLVGSTPTLFRHAPISHGPTARAGVEFCQAHGLRIALTHDRNRLRYQGVAIDGASTRDPMTASTAANSLAEEGARVTRAINDSIKRFSSMSGPNFMPEGMPPFMQAAQEYNAKLLEFGIANYDSDVRMLLENGRSKIDPRTGRDGHAPGPRPVRHVHGTSQATAGHCAERHAEGPGGLSTLRRQNRSPLDPRKSTDSMATLPTLKADRRGIAPIPCAYAPPSDLYVSLRISE